MQFQEVERRFSSINLDALPGPMQKLDMNAGFQQLREVDDALVLTESRR